LEGARENTIRFAQDDALLLNPRNRANHSDGRFGIICTRAASHATKCIGCVGQIYVDHYRKRTETVDPFG